MSWSKAVIVGVSCRKNAPIGPGLAPSVHLLALLFEKPLRRRKRMGPQRALAGREPTDAAVDDLVSQQILPDAQHVAFEPVDTDARDGCSGAIWQARRSSSGRTASRLRDRDDRVSVRLALDGLRGARRGPTGAASR
jgi:hypothetical protein